MRRVILSLVRTLGRYAVIPVFCLFLLIGYSLLVLIDVYPIVASSLLLVFVPLLMASFALLIGLFFSGIPKRRGDFVLREEAPKLWGVWDELSKKVSGKRQLIIDSEMNASMGERRSFLGIAGREITMTIGLPYLLCLDEPALRSVVAHEIGHSELAHSSGLANLVEFEQTFETLFEYVDPDTTIVGAIAFLLVGKIGDWLEAEILRLSRKHEYEADQVAAERGSASQEARSSVICEALVKYYHEEIVKPLNVEMRGAMRAPKSPLKRIESDLERLRTPTFLETYARLGWDEDADPKSTHPSLKQRVQALGIEEMPPIGQMGQSAADNLLPDDVKKRLFETFQKEWRDRAEAVLQLQ